MCAVIGDLPLIVLRTGSTTGVVLPIDFDGSNLIGVIQLEGKPFIYTGYCSSRHFPGITCIAIHQIMQTGTVIGSGCEGSQRSKIVRRDQRHIDHQIGYCRQLCSLVHRLNPERQIGTRRQAVNYYLVRSVGLLQTIGLCIGIIDTEPVSGNIFGVRSRQRQIRLAVVIVTCCGCGDNRHMRIGGGITGAVCTQLGQTDLLVNGITLCGL